MLFFVYLSSINNSLHSFFPCSECQNHKKQGPGYVNFPSIEYISAIYEEVYVDFIGPCKNEIRNIGVLQICAVAIIYTAIMTIEKIESKTTPLPMFNSISKIFISPLSSPPWFYL